MATGTGLYVVADKSRFNKFSITLYEPDGTESFIRADDIVRVKVGRVGDGLLLEVASNAATANGSTTTAANPTVLSMEAADVAFPAGVYDVEVDVWDIIELRFKKAERGIFVLRDSMLGGTS